jgi:DNA-binding GntR family transcriptional regulator
LSRLSTEGLVTQVDHRGFAVATLGLADLESLLNARCWLDGIGVRESIARGDAVWEEGVVLAFHRLSRTPRHTGSDNQRNPTWEKLHADFHASLLSACGSSWLFGFCRQLFEAAERYRHVARLAGVQRSPNEDQHRAIMNATVARDPESASALLAAHYRRTAELVRKVLAERESPHK